MPCRLPRCIRLACTISSRSPHRWHCVRNLTQVPTPHLTQTLTQTLATIALTLSLSPAIALRPAAATPRRDATAIALSAEQLSNAHDRLGFQLFQELATRRIAEAETAENFVMSPASLSLSLALLYGGARSHTQQAMAVVLGVSGEPATVDAAYSRLLAALDGISDDVTLDIANAIWGNDDVRLDEAFVQSRRDRYRAQVEQIDFSDTNAALRQINGWVADRTRNQIERIVSRNNINADTVAILLNAVYFSGNWTHPFREAHTEPAPFLRLDGSVGEVSMMSGRLPVRLYENGRFQAVELPYGEVERLAMYVFLPRPEMSLFELTQEFDAENWANWRRRFEWTASDILVRLPRFNLDTDIDYRTLLATLGLASLFEPGADFSGLSATPFWLASVRQKTHIDVNEAGTEAGAATATSASRGATPVVVCDRPFLFLISDRETGAILFLGSIVDPAS